LSNLFTSSEEQANKLVAMGAIEPLLDQLESGDETLQEQVLFSPLSKL